jgi:hypothetical protein
LPEWVNKMKGTKIEGHILYIIIKKLRVNIWLYSDKYSLLCIYLLMYFKRTLSFTKKNIDNNKKRNVFKKCENTSLTIYVELRQPV